MNATDYWNKKHGKYSDTDWINKPSLFAKWAVSYFPNAAEVLELGAGQAQDSRYFDSIGYKVTSTDFSPTALEVAKEKSPSSITFKQLDLSKPFSFKDVSFDIVYSHLSMHYFDEQQTKALFSEVKRILKPGGTLIALFNSTQDPELSEGALIEPKFIEINGIKKRFFDPESARNFAEEFDIIIADTDGTTYKDHAIGVSNLIRLVARKTI